MTELQFGQLVAQYERLVYTICYQFSQNHHTAEDLTQETFLAAFRHVDDCPADNPRPWFSRIAVNKAKDHLKSAYNRKISPASDETMPEEKGALFLQHAQPEDITLSRDTVRAIAGKILGLKEPYRKVSVLYFLEEHSVEEISQALERPAKTVHTQLYRAKRMLQKSLEGGNPDGTF